MAKQQKECLDDLHVLEPGYSCDVTGWGDPAIVPWSPLEEDPGHLAGGAAVCGRGLPLQAIHLEALQWIIPQKEVQASQVIAPYICHL